MLCKYRIVQHGEDSLHPSLLDLEQSLVVTGPRN